MEGSYLAGRTAYITGGLSGQGLAVAHALTARGADLALGSYLSTELTGEPRDACAYPDPAYVEDARRALEALGVRVFASHLDVRESEAVERFCRAAREAVGPADILVNAAGTTGEHGVCDHPDALWEKILGTNLSGTFRMIRACMPDMKRRGWGRIVNFSSTAAWVGSKDNPAYCASKSGILGLTRAVALDGAPFGVTCTAICPTWVETEMLWRDAAQLAEREDRGRTADEVVDEIRAANPMGRVVRPEETAALVAFLCSEEARPITMTDIRVTGGALW